MLPLSLMDTFMVHCLFCQTPILFEVFWCLVVTQVWNDMRMIYMIFNIWVNCAFKEVVLCYVYVIYDVYQFLSVTLYKKVQ